MYRTRCLAIGLLGLWSTNLAALSSPASAGAPIAYKNEGLWGLIDSQGRVVITPQFDEIFVNDSGVARAKKNGVSSYYDSTGSMIADAAVEQELDFDTDGLAVASANEKAGLKDKSGGFVVQPQFGYVHRFGPTMQYVVHYGGGVGVIDLSTKRWVVPNNFQYIGTLSKGGLANAKLKGQKGFINGKGDWVLQPGTFEDVGSFDDFNMAVARKGGKCGFINDKFEWVIPPVSEEDYCFFGFDQAGLFRFRQGEKTGLLNRQGIVVLAAKFDEIGWLSGGFYRARVGKKWGFIDDKGRLAISPRFASAGNFDKEHMATVNENGRDVVITRTGKVLWGQKFEAIGHFGNDNWVPAKLKGKWGTVDRNGRWIVAPKYECISWCYDAPPPVVSIQAGRPLYFRPDVQ